MRYRIQTYHWLLLLTFFSCRKPYIPPVANVDYSYIVIDGVINANPNGVTTVMITRTRDLNDTTVAPKPELGAQAVIEAENGGSYPLVSQGDGRYMSAPLNLAVTGRYRLKVSTNLGGSYTSDFVPVKQTPPVDSLTWTQSVDTKEVSIFAHTHDPQNNTRYYRWEYEETYQYEASEKASWGLSGQNIYYIDPYPFALNQQYDCFSTFYSSDVMVATSAQLATDVISYQPIQKIPRGSEKIGMRYSILVKQYGLTDDAYKYWDLLKKNTQKTGTVFDPQPSQTLGNIKSVSNPSEPVIGFASASLVTEKRMFIDSTQVTDWNFHKSFNDCLIGVIPVNSNIYLYTYPDTSFAPFYYSQGTLVITKKNCIDCRRRGGSAIKPIFW